MAYSSLDAIKKVLPEAALIQLTDDEDAGSVNTGRVDEAIAQADGEIDTYIGGRYSVPLISVPAIIRRCSCDIVIYILYKRRLEDIPETRATSYKDAIRTLDRIAKGEINLPVADSDVDAFASGVLVTSHFEASNA